MGRDWFRPNDLTMKKRDLERLSSAITLSDMEVFIFPELMYSLVLANIMSPRIWRWRDDPWFKGIFSKPPYRRIQRLKQFIMDHYTFNLDLETWGLTTKQRELTRFSDFVAADTLARSNALFGYEGDKYYFDIDIRTHFGLDKYNSDIIPYWKTETVEAMDAFVHRPGYSTGAGECVSLAALYAAALFIVAGIPLEDIFLMATPLHSQNFVLVGDGILINNRRLVTKAMWFNGTALSSQARRALENERVTIVAHSSGYIHVLYPEATIARQQYERFASRLVSFLHGEVSPEMLGNFLRQSPECSRCFVVRWQIHGVNHYVPLERVFAYEQNCPYRLTDPSRKKLMEEIEQEEFSHTHCPRKIVFDDVEEYLRDKKNKVSLDNPESVARLKRQVHCSCLNAENAIDQLVRFAKTEPELPDSSTHQFTSTQPPITLEPGCSREEAVEHIAGLSRDNEFARMAFYAFRDLDRTDSRPFIHAAMLRSPIALEAATAMGFAAFADATAALDNQSIYEEDTRLAQPDEVWNFQRGDGLERVLMLAMAYRELKQERDLAITVDGERATLADSGGNTIISLPSRKQPREKSWLTREIGLRDE